MQSTESKTKPTWEDEIPLEDQESPDDLNQPTWEEEIPIEEGESAKIEVDAIGTTAPDDPYEVRTNHSFSTHPMSKGIVVLGLCFGLLSAGGILFIALTGGFAPPTNTVASKPEEPPKEIPQIAESDTLRAKLLIREQRKEVEKFNQEKQVKEAAKTTPAPAQQTAPVAVAPQRVIYSAPPRPAPTYSRPVTYSAPPRPAPTYSRPVTYSPPPQRVTQPISPPPLPRLAPQEPPQDPSQQWLAAANMGSYGSLSATQQSPTTVSRGKRGNYQNVNSETLETETTATKSTDTDSSSPYQSANYANSAGSNVIVGTKVAAKLETPIAWSGSLKNPDQNFLIQLNEPLKASNNTVVIPKGAYLVAKISAADQVGLLNMSVTSALVSENGLTSEKPIPSGVLLILGKDGQPLKASSQRRNTTGTDLGTVILSGAATTADLINRPRTETVYNSNGYSSTTTNSDPNYIAGFGEGASEALLQQMQNRNNQSRQEARSEPKVFTLKQGTSLQVFVNKTTAL